MMFKLKKILNKAIVLLALTIMWGDNNYCWATNSNMFTFDMPMSILVDKNGQSNSVSNVYSLNFQYGKAPQDIFPGSPGPVVFGISFVSRTPQQATIDGELAEQVNNTLIGGGFISGLFYSQAVSVNGSSPVYATGAGGNDSDIEWLPESNQNTLPTFRIYERLGSGNGYPVVPGIYNTGGGVFMSAVYVKDLSTGKYERYFVITSASPISVTTSTCMLQTARDISINWPSVSPSEIANHSAGVKPAAIQVACEDMSTHMLVTVSSSHGSNDAANGIVNTDKPSLGLQLKWASDGTPVVLDQQRDFPPASTKDFTINAQPVATGSSAITAGDFATDVTVTLEYK